MQIFVNGKQRFQPFAELYVINLKKSRGKNLIIVALTLKDLFKIFNILARILKILEDLCKIFQRCFKVPRNTPISKDLQ